MTKSKLMKNTYSKNKVCFIMVPSTILYGRWGSIQPPKYIYIFFKQGQKLQLSSLLKMSIRSPKLHSIYVYNPLFLSDLSLKTPPTLLCFSFLLQNPKNHFLYLTPNQTSLSLSLQQSVFSFSSITWRKTTGTMREVWFRPNFFYFSGISF